MGGACIRPQTSYKDLRTARRKETIDKIKRQSMISAQTLQSQSYIENPSFYEQPNIFKQTKRFTQYSPRRTEIENNNENYDGNCSKCDDQVQEQSLTTASMLYTQQKYPNKFQGDQNGKYDSNYNPPKAQKQSQNNVFENFEALPNFEEQNLLLSQLLLVRIITQIELLNQGQKYLNVDFLDPNFTFLYLLLDTQENSGNAQKKYQAKNEFVKFRQSPDSNDVDDDINHFKSNSQQMIDLTQVDLDQLDPDFSQKICVMSMDSQSNGGHLHQFIVGSNQSGPLSFAPKNGLLGYDIDYLQQMASFGNQLPQEAFTKQSDQQNKEIQFEIQSGLQTMCQ